MLIILIYNNSRSEYTPMSLNAPKVSVIEKSFYTFHLYIHINIHI